MHKINVSYSEKRPGDFEYSSKSYHVSLEVEVPGNLDIRDLQKEIHNVCKIAESAVKAELDGATHEAYSEKDAPAPRQLSLQNNQTKTANAVQTGQATQPASTKQVKYLIDLLTANNYNLDEVMQHYKVNSLCDLSKTQCSTLIDQVRGGNSQAA